MSSTLSKKKEQIKSRFARCQTQEERYEAIIELGRALPPMPEIDKTAERLVSGCQSLLYLNCAVREEKLFFQAASEALISSGLAALLINVYSGETAETILSSPPDYLEELGIPASLTPSRAGGLYSLHLRIKQEAIKHLVASAR